MFIRIRVKTLRPERAMQSRTEHIVVYDNNAFKRKKTINNPYKTFRMFESRRGRDYQLHDCKIT